LQSLISKIKNYTCMFASHLGYLLIIFTYPISTNGCRDVRQTCCPLHPLMRKCLVERKEQLDRHLEASASNPGIATGFEVPLCFLPSESTGPKPREKLTVSNFSPNVFNFKCSTLHNFTPLYSKLPPDLNPWPKVVTSLRRCPWMMWLWDRL